VHDSAHHGYGFADRWCAANRETVIPYMAWVLTLAAVCAEHFDIDVKDLTPA